MNVMKHPALLRMQAQVTLIESDDATVTIPVGPRGIAESTLHHDPPTPAEIERAIDVVEDALGAARLPQAERGSLVTSDRLLRQLPSLGTPGASLGLEQVEQLFQRLASRALGMPVPIDEIPAGREMAAALVILRELMQHLGFDRIVVDAEHS